MPPLEWVRFALDHNFEPPGLENVAKLPAGRQLAELRAAASGPAS
jgi:hypothetical protein